MKWKEKNDLKSDTIHVHVHLDIFMEQMLYFFYDYYFVSWKFRRSAAANGIRPTLDKL